MQDEREAIEEAGSQRDIREAANRLLEQVAHSPSSAVKSDAANELIAQSKKRRAQMTEEKT